MILVTVYEHNGNESLECKDGKLNVLLTVHCNVSIQQDQQDVMFAFSLLQSIACTCFEHLFAHHQEVLCTQQLVYFVCIVLGGC